MKKTSPLKRSALRTARRQIARGCLPIGNRDISTTRTRVLPLADSVADAVWNQARTAALTLRGFGSGSLFDLLLDLHASGLRLFSSNGEREGFLLKQKFDAGKFDRAAAKDVGEDMPKFTAANLRAALVAIPRGGGPDTDAKALATRLARAVGVKATKLDKPPKLLKDMAKELAMAFPTWKELSTANGEVGAVIDDVARMYGLRWPSLRRGWAFRLPEVTRELGSPTLAFDPDAPVIDETSATARFAAIVARYLPECGGLTDSAAAKGVQARITTTNANGLSWLFGVGLRGMRDLPVDTVADTLAIDVTRGRDALRALVNDIKALPRLGEFGDRVYVESRATLQGAVDSLIANYVGRLADLVASADALEHDQPRPPVLDDADWKPAIFDGMGFTPWEVEDMLDARPVEVARLRLALGVLAGTTPAVAGDFARALADVEAFGAWAARTEAVAAQINARVKVLKAPESLRLRGVLGGGRWKAVVSIHPDEGEPAQVIPQLDTQLQALLDDGQRAFDVLVADYTPTFAAALEHARSDMRASLADKGREAPSAESIDLLARRKLLDMVARVTRRGSPSLGHAFLAACAVQGLTRPGTATERSLRGHILSGEQALFVHPYARARSIVRLEHAGLLRLDLDALLTAMERDAEQRADVREQIVLRFTRQSLLLGGLPGRIRLAKVPWTQEAAAASGVRGAPWLKLHPDDAGTVARSEVIKAFTARFHLSANGLLYRLNRMRFLERYDIRCFIGDTLLFAPKAGAWTPPEQYRHGKYAHWLSHPDLPRTEGGAVDVVPAARWLTEASRRADEDGRASAVALLAQFPHEWVAACEFEGAPVYEGVFPCEGKIGGWMKRRGYRLAPPRHFAGELLAAFKDASVSPHGLTFEREMLREGTTVRELSRRVVAAYPIAVPTHPDAERPWSPLHLMGLDLGEAGLGVCLRHIGTGAETTLLLPVRKTRLLAHREEHYRRKVQPRQAFRKGYGDAMELAVKAAIGEVCGIIDNLIVRYRAVPVFESAVAQARGSNKMIQRVFAGVVQHYTFVANNGAAQTVRQSHWFGAGRWSYTYGADLLPAARQMTEKQLLKAKAEAVFRPAMGFPGVMASGYRTSLVCACCGEDVLDAVDAAAEGGQVALTTDAEGSGVLDLGGRSLRIKLEAPSPNPIVQKAARRKRRRTPWEALADRTWTLTHKTDRADLVATLRRGLRRPPASVQGHATSGWEFHCAACGHIAQADVNAATNLVRRYDDRVRKMEQARAHWDDPSVRAKLASELAERAAARS